MQTLVLFPAFAAILQILCRGAEASFDADFHFQLLIQDGSDVVGDSIVADLASGDPADSPLTAPADSALTAPGDSPFTAPADSALTAPADSALTTPADVVAHQGSVVTVTTPVDTTTTPLPLEVPSAVEILGVYGYSPGVMRVDWFSPQNGSASVTGYKVTWICAENVGVVIVDPNTTYHLLTTWTPCVDCNVSVTWTASGVENTNPPATKSFNSGPAEPPLVYAWHRLIRNNTIQVNWNNMGNCLKNFDFFWKKISIGNDSITETRGDDVVKVTDNQYEFEDIPDLTYFSYCLTAKGGSSKNFTAINTQCNSLLVDHRPPPPTIDALSAITPGYMTVMWHPSADYAGILKKFIIQLYNEQTKEYTYTNFTAIPTSVDSSTSLSHQYRTLLKGVKYTVSVAQVNNWGAGPYSNSLSIRTAT